MKKTNINGEKLYEMSSYSNILRGIVTTGAVYGTHRLIYLCFDYFQEQKKMGLFLLLLIGGLLLAAVLTYRLTKFLRERRTLTLYSNGALVRSSDMRHTRTWNILEYPSGKFEDEVDITKYERTEVYLAYKNAKGYERIVNLQIAKYDREAVEGLYRKIDELRRQHGLRSLGYTVKDTHHYKAEGSPSAPSAGADWEVFIPDATPAPRAKEEARVWKENEWGHVEQNYNVSSDGTHYYDPEAGEWKRIPGK